MKRFVVDQSGPSSLLLAEAAEPTPQASECVIAVKAYSLNRGELVMATDRESGTPIGWDVAGVVERSAADGSGPSVGERVVAFLERADGWAEQVAAPTEAVAVLPDEVGFELAATLPVAGLTALHCCEKAGSVLGRRVLVTGATGGVGLFAVQLATRMGATVTAQVRREEQRELVESHGAAEVVVTSTGEELSDVGPFDLVVDGVGGPMFAACVRSLVPGGTICVYGGTGGVDVGLRIFPDFVGNGSNRHVVGMTLYTEDEPHGHALGRLLRPVLSGDVRMEISRKADWSRTPELAAGLLSREFTAKAVATI